MKNEIEELVKEFIEEIKLNQVLFNGIVVEETSFNRIEVLGGASLRVSSIFATRPLPNPTEAYHLIKKELSFRGINVLEKSELQSKIGF